MPNGNSDSDGSRKRLDDGDGVTDGQLREAVRELVKRRLRQQRGRAADNTDEIAREADSLSVDAAVPDQRTPGYGSPSAPLLDLAPGRELHRASNNKISGELPLYTWQREALDSWRAAAHRGVVQAVTGAGKTLVGVSACVESQAAGRRVLILVPTIELQRQWQAVLHRQAAHLRVGLLGGGDRQDLLSNDVLISTAPSAARNRPLLPHGVDGLLIADECHRYGAPTRAEALDPAFERRLGLTATLERGDAGNAAFLTPFFGGVVFDLWYDRALRDGVIAPFRVALTGVDFEAADRMRYETYDEDARAARADVFRLADPPERPFAEFMRYVNLLSEGGSGTDPRAVAAARRYLSAFSKRRELLATTSCKVPVLHALAPAVRSSAGTLVFTQTKDSADHAAATLAGAGCSTTAIYSGMEGEERQLRMASFRDGAVDLLSAPRLLDEGIDVPEADLGIVVAASRSQRQMIQRLGRVIRKKSDGRAGRLVVLFVKGTSEDPGRHEDNDFLSRCLPHAEAVTEVDTCEPEWVPALLDFLATPDRPGEPARVVGALEPETASAAGAGNAANRDENPTSQVPSGQVGPPGRTIGIRVLDDDLRASGLAELDPYSDLPSLLAARALDQFDDLDIRSDDFSIEQSWDLATYRHRGHA